jgi:hypothetical protein
MSFTIDYKLTGAGWAECIVEANGQKASLSASYLSDALGELLRAAVNLLEGVRGNTVSFAEEPGEYRWRLIRVDSEQIHVSVLSFDKLWGNEPDEAGNLVFQTVCPVREFAAAVASAAQRILDEYGVDGYREQWVNYDFPTDRLLRIQDLLAS